MISRLILNGNAPHTYQPCFRNIFGLGYGYFKKSWSFFYFRFLYPTCYTELVSRGRWLLVFILLAFIAKSKFLKKTLR